jgi:DNA-binding winged helix-turn-helix (wHTH) protein
MIDSQGAWREQVASFGPFRPHAARRTLERSVVGHNLGSRALDTFIILVERAGEIAARLN